MKIAFLTPEYPHPKTGNFGGIGTSVKNLAEVLVKEGVAITIFVYGQKTQEIIEENEISIHLIKNKKFQFLGWFFHRKDIQHYCNVIIKKEKIDLIEAPDWTGITAFMSFKIPLVIRFHGSDSYFCQLEKRKQKWKNFLFEKLATNNATAFIAPTKFAGKVSRNIFSIKNKEIKTIHNSLELEKFSNDTSEVFESGLILYLGTLIRKKGVLELPEIFNRVRKEFPSAKLVLVGNDSYDINTNSSSTWQLTQQLFKEDDLEHVEYKGKVSYDEVQTFIKGANVCVFPSFAETLGMVTIEAMAMQKAVVNTNIGWAQELIIDGESGFLVHPENHDLYAKRIIQLLQNKKLTLEIGRQARLRVEDKFDNNKLVKNNIEFYARIISSKSNL